jgi:hypothetical protein
MLGNQIASWLPIERPEVCSLLDNSENRLNNLLSRPNDFIPIPRKRFSHPYTIAALLPREVLFNIEQKSDRVICMMVKCQIHATNSRRNFASKFMTRESQVHGQLSGSLMKVNSKLLKT